MLRGGGGGFDFEKYYREKGREGGNGGGFEGVKRVYFVRERLVWIFLDCVLRAGIGLFTSMECFVVVDLSWFFIELHARGDGRSSPESEMNFFLKPTRRCSLKDDLLRQHHAEPYAPGEMIGRERQTGMNSCSQPEQLQKIKVPLTADVYSLRHRLI